VRNWRDLAQGSNAEDQCKQKRNGRNWAKHRTVPIES
jgi:hypothetical protein